VNSEQVEQAVTALQHAGHVVRGFEHGLLRK
jgi:hypothetical protein